MITVNKNKENLENADYDSNFQIGEEIDMTIYKEIICEKQGEICLIKINKPKVLNALTPSIFVELNYALDDIEADDEVRVVIITGEGRAFAAGADISYMKDLDAQGAKEFAKHITSVLRRMESLDKVFIAAVNGFALGGGCELAMACDLRIADKHTQFGLPETSLGVIPGFSGTQRLTRLVGLTRAKEMVLTAERITAEEAYRIGLVNKIADDGMIMEEAYKMANKIIKNASIAVSYGKEAINRGIQLDMDSAIDYEKNLFGLCFATADQKEGMTAFVEKRTPNFINR